ncbi:unnamed protein product [Tilletia controversa]|uniref:Carboxylesterase type B domain-containing protein n=3 Tax=Tilletia TaxID=13289 RepID=A0A8X7N1Z0_9BASI|nr:hypothetical protein CF335_g4132 [Tilletia laevis]KAE8206059.1 hypothetical protein CF328_g140 [Tilletia controversa]KAE8259429.1 hypothetical protein A4X03_0g4097 [Tilletia caries]KAE8200795.1 hypothetical protein CF336_g516 [Tilletia laevis]KAE8255898.1 hypothetical protein A4X06_0g202 [Tilletia controversa]
MRFSLQAAAVLVGFAAVTAATHRHPHPHARQANGDYTLVDTTSGQARGVYLSNSGVYRYLGIPYAEDTGGQNRFKPAVRKARVSGIIDATHAGPSCVSTQGNASRGALGFTGQQLPDPSTWSEDCLLVNLYVNQAIRQRAGKGAKAAVIIYVYGGSFMTGSPTIPIYDGVPFASANEDTIFVTFSYRHSIFGNPMSPQVTEYKGVGWNFGLTDMHLMLDWLQDNVASFGGDPNKIVMFGGSSGSTMVDAYGFSEYGKRNSVAKGLIIQSGAVLGMKLATGRTSNTDFGRPASEWNTVASAVGCGKSGDEAQLACMRSKSWSEIAAASVSAGLAFGPTPDDVTWFSDFEARSASGKVAKIPTIIGTNLNEATLFGDPNSALQSKIADAIFTPPYWTCPAAIESADRARAGVPTWRYLYSGGWDAFLQGRPWIGTYHFSEIPQILGTTPAHWLSDPSKSAPATPDQLANSRLFQKMWTAFAHDPLHGLEQFQWPLYNPLKRTTAHIAKDNQQGLVMEVGSRADDKSCLSLAPLTKLMQGMDKTIKAGF